MIFDCGNGEGAALVEGAHYFFGCVSGDQRSFGYALDLWEWGEGFGVGAIPEVLDCLVGVVVCDYLAGWNVNYFAHSVIRQRIFGSGGRRSLPNRSVWYLGRVQCEVAASSSSSFQFDAFNEAPVSDCRVYVITE